MEIYTIAPLNMDNAREIITWRYDPPYDLYDLSPEDLSGLLNPEYRYHQVQDRKGCLAGYCCFGIDAQVPGGRYPQNEPEFLDIGVGMKPGLTGQGRGTKFVGDILDYARKAYSPHNFRATIASFNKRSLKTFQNHEFQIRGSFTRELVKIKFYLVEKPVKEE